MILVRVRIVKIEQADNFNAIFDTAHYSKVLLTHL